VDDSSPGSREAEGEGGEDFYIGKRADLLVSPGEMHQQTSHTMVSSIAKE
jgi:hypothetical protein